MYACILTVGATSPFDPLEREMPTPLKTMASTLYQTTPQTFLLKRVTTNSRTKKAAEVGHVQAEFHNQWGFAGVRETTPSNRITIIAGILYQAAAQTIPKKEEP